MKPMLAANIETSAIRMPCYVSTKLDGVRAVVIDGQLRSRSLKPIPNRYTSNLFSNPLLNGLDGELIVGAPTAKNCFAVTVSAVSREAGEPSVYFYVFDNYLDTGTFEERWKRLSKRTAALRKLNVLVVNQSLVHREEDLLALEAVALTSGYEGLISRSPSAFYKHRRSTANDQGMLKIKRFVDSEAVVLDVIEEMENTNLATTNALGRTERSSMKSGLKPKGRMGALAVRDITSGVEFQIGTGFDSKAREQFWTNRDAVVKAGIIVKYKCFPIGVKDAPRFPVYLGVRAGFDL